ncbi:MAG: hypothetical protein IJ736_14275, partial [Firmicutes bacterium]|nr:hypothetical protein [Bacillota bacterium]
YENESDIPDIGGFKAISITGANVRHYYGLSGGVSKFINAVRYANEGSDAYVVDTGEVYIFFDKQWRKQ